MSFQFDSPLLPLGLKRRTGQPRQQPHSRLRHIVRRMAGALLCVGMCLGSASAVQAQSNFPPVAKGDIYHVLSTRNELTLTERFSRVIELEQRITRVDGFDPGILTVSALTPNRIRVQAITAGVTTLILVDEHDKVYTIEVYVDGDVRHLQSEINRMFPDSSVNALKVKDSVVLRGVVADPSHISQIAEIAEQFYPKVINHMKFGAANQVRLQVRIMEAQRSRIRQLGFNWSFVNNSGYVSSNPGSLAAPNTATLIPGGLPGLEHGAGALSDSAVSFGLVNSNSVFRGFLEALKQEGLLRILVETSVVADSGRPASLLSGGEFPILVPQALGTLSVEWREFGVKLEAVPIVLGHGQVVLEIAPEFSERDFANSATLNNTTIPAITTRRANTQVRMKFGQTLMIGGLIATRYTAETDKFPILGELPGIGAAFRRVRYDENETELIILVTPEYVAPLDPHQVPDGGPGRFSGVPTDRELYWQGLIEVPNYGGPVPPNAHHGHHGYEEYCPPPGQTVPMPQIPSQMQQRSQPPLNWSPDSDFEEGPPPYVPDERNDKPLIKSAPGAVAPALPLPIQPPPELPHNLSLPELEPAPAKKNTSSLPVLPVMPAPGSRPKPVENPAVSDAGLWQRSTGRVEIQQASARQPILPAGDPRWTQTSAERSQATIDQERPEELPGLIAPKPRQPAARPAISAPNP